MDMIITKELAYEFEMPSSVRVYKDGSVERIPSPNPDPETGVSSKDITISQNPTVSARLYLPNLSTHQHYPNPKLPVFVYFHGGGFITGSAFSSLYHRYLNILVSQAGVVVVSVEYRLAPENPLPAAYDDCWTALQWVASHTIGNKPDKESDPWLLNCGDFGRIFIGGDSSGGNIAHNVAMRAGIEDLKGGVKIFGALVGYPFFWGSKPIGSEPTADREKYWATLVWDLVYPTAPGGIDNPMINPFGVGKPSLATLGCSKMLVYVAEKEPLRDREILYSNEVKESGWGGEMGLFEAEGQHHLFHILNPESDNAKILMKRLVLFFLD